MIKLLRVPGGTLWREKADDGVTEQLLRRSATSPAQSPLHFDRFKGERVVSIAGSRPDSTGQTDDPHPAPSVCQPYEDNTWQIHGQGKPPATSMVIREQNVRKHHLLSCGPALTRKYGTGFCVQCRLPAECYPTLHTHYEEIGCEPVFGDGPCPLKYDCSLFMARNSSRCYLNGTEYEIGDSIGNIYSMCSAACFCDGRSESGAVITCASIECPEFFRRPAPNCISQYFLDDCCSNSTFCKNKTEDVTEVTCNVGNETFIEGQKFYPSDDD
uniref:VWFC domain-containing protein n=1 Tax=Timema douglasi TaxID=61478 RepID=A0A7R8VLR2_TIMDO|nr:unnamed protein product [Timema douglasi]